MRALPLRPFARERLVLALVALTAFDVVQFPNTQDKTRLSLTQSILEHGDVTIERYGTPIDRGRHGRHLYTDKAPGLSLVALTPVALIRAGERLTGARRVRLVWDSNGRLLFVRLLSLAPFLLLLAWLVGRVCEGLAAGTGAAAAVAAACGTTLGGLSTVLFAHVISACLGFAAFLLLARGRTRWGLLAAGALAGTAVLMDYEAGLLAAVLAVLVVFAYGPSTLGWYLLGALPPALVLGAYDAIAFGSPLRLSYRFKTGPNATEQSEGFFGIGRPRLGHLGTALGGEHGLLRTSPVLVLAATGLVLLWRRGLRAVAVTAASMIVLYLLLEAGYFDPVGGFSPGPRFFAPAVPFLVLGFACVARRAPWPAAALVAVSVGLCTWNAFTWFTVGHHDWPRPSLNAVGVPRSAGIAVVAVVAAVTVAVASAPLLRRR